MVAIVGPTGAGKIQPLSNLLIRFYDLTAGSISVDGHDIHRLLSRQDYHVNSLVGASRMAWLLEGTIKENLCFDNLDYDWPEGNWLETAKAANKVDHFIRTLLLGGFSTWKWAGSSNISLGPSNSGHCVRF